MRILGYIKDLYIKHISPRLEKYRAEGQFRLNIVRLYHFDYTHIDEAFELLRESRGLLWKAMLGNRMGRTRPVDT